MLDSGRLVIDGDIASLRRSTADVVVRVDGNVERFRAALQRRGIESTVQGADILVVAETDRDFDAVRDAVIEAECALRALKPRELSLEDVYIRTVSGLAEPAAEVAAVAGGS